MTATATRGASAGAKAMLQASRDWGKERVQWGQPIGHHDAIAQKLGKMAANTFAIVELAVTDEQRQRGLMGRERLEDGTGMLFVFPDEQVRSFWMKNTLIPLSIAYIDSDGRIIDLQDMKALDDEPPHYVSTEPARYALEANKGFFDERGVKVGDRAELPG